MKLPDLSQLGLNLQYKSLPYKNTLLDKNLILKIRNLVDLRYKYSSNWELIFSTFEHGSSYKHLLQSFTNRNKPFVMILKGKKVLIIYFEEHLELNLKPFGVRKVILICDNKEISLPGIKKIICTEEYFAFGIKEGKYGVLVDSRMREVEENVFSEGGEKFEIKYLEIWNILE